MAKWYDDSGFQNDIVLSTRVRLARNIKDIPFPGKMTDADGALVVEKVENALKRLNMNFAKTDIPSATIPEKNRLVEKRFISPGFVSNQRPSAVFVSDDESISIMVNEEDHIRFQAIYAGFECEKAYEIISKVDSVVAETVDYAVHQKYGYLTSCLTNAGTGIRISFMMHLPAICKARVAESLFSAISKLGVTVRGMFGEGSKASGYLFQVSNQMTLGVTEKEIADRVTEVVNKLIAKERELRAEIHQKEGMVIEDKIMRAEGILKSARLLSTKEMLNLFSYVRFGISVGLIRDIDSRTLNLLMVETGPAHLTKEKDDPVQRDMERATRVRNELKEE